MYTGVSQFSWSESVFVPLYFLKSIESLKNKNKNQQRGDSSLFRGTDAPATTSYTAWNTAANQERWLTGSRSPEGTPLPDGRTPSVSPFPEQPSQQPPCCSIWEREMLGTGSTPSPIPCLIAGTLGWNMYDRHVIFAESQWSVDQGREVAVTIYWNENSFPK